MLIVARLRVAIGGFAISNNARNRYFIEQFVVHATIAVESQNPLSRCRKSDPIVSRLPLRKIH